MHHALTKEERETTLLYTQTKDPVIISTFVPTLQHRLATFDAKHTNCCKRIDKQRYSNYLTKSRAISKRSACIPSNCVLQ